MAGTGASDEGSLVTAKNRRTSCGASESLAGLLDPGRIEPSALTVGRPPLLFHLPADETPPAVLMCRVVELMLAHSVGVEEHHAPESRVAGTALIQEEPPNGQVTRPQAE